MLYKEFHHLLTEKVRRKFWSRVHKPSTDECWPWQGGGKDGYGLFCVTGIGNIQASRVAWTCVNGKIPDELHILHSCNRPICVNPKHLRPGTPLENMEDRSKANRGHRPAGDTNGRAILTSENVLAIRKSQETNEVLSLRYGVGTSQISRVRNRLEWQTV